MIALSNGRKFLTLIHHGMWMTQLRGEVDWRGKGFREEKISKRCGHAVVEVFEMCEVCCVLPLHNGVAVLNMSIHTYVSENNYIK